MSLSQLPVLTRDVAPVPAVVRRTVEDFRVEEIPLYEPVGEGDHVFLVVEKRDLTTPDLIRQLARALGVSAQSIGCAGLKDAHGITCQTLSVEHIDPGRVLDLQLDGVRVLSAVRHTNKLRRGHLSGNRFRIVLRDTDPTRLADVRQLFARFESEGLPNGFGPQRFGNRGDTGTIGAAIVRGDHGAAARLIAGAPGPSDHGPVRRARELYDKGDFAAAAAAWPRGYSTSARLCAAMTRNKGRASRAIRTLAHRELAFYVSAWQAELFNHVLAKRIDRIGHLEDGELAWNHGSRRTFAVLELEAERQRAARFELSPTGPLVGPKMERPTGEAARLEETCLAENGVNLDDLGRRWKENGARRPLRVPLHESSVNTLADDSAALELAFTLPAGAYATSVLAEVCKDRLTVASRGDEE